MRFTATVRNLLFLAIILSATAARAESYTILVMGDSIGAAYGLNEEDGWASLTEKALQEDGLDVSVVNASISGDTTAGGLRRLPDALDRFEPDLLVIELGGNDGLRGYPPKTMQKNLEDMASIAQDTGNRCAHSWHDDSVELRAGVPEPVREGVHVGCREYRQCSDPLSAGAHRAGSSLFPGRWHPPDRGCTTVTDGACTADHQIIRHRTTVHQHSPASGVTAQTSSEEFWSAVRDILPMAAGVATYGLAFGLLAAQAGMDELQVGTMGGLVFAGASQIVAVERLIAGAGATAALVAAIALNLRLLLITASIRDVFVGRPWWQLLIGAHLCTDENWALTLAARARGTSAGYWYLVGGGACLFVTWVVATTIGAYFAAAIPDPESLGIDFAFTAAFIAIAVSLWRRQHDLIPWLVSVSVVAVITLSGALPSSWALILGACAGAFVAAVWPTGFMHR